MASLPGGIDGGGPGGKFPKPDGGGGGGGGGGGAAIAILMFQINEEVRNSQREKNLR